ncbi:MAG: lipopolysaccharide biosynthesis protein [Acidobacteria bacterium]|nr:lipopolysaccharide biosynthesis protein [Acidobacteriota bacterium]
MDRVLVRGLAWTSAGSWGGQVVAWGVTLLVVRLLTPADYGLVAMANLYMGLLRLVNELGLGAAVVQRRDLTRQEVASLGGVSVLVGLACCLASVAVSGWLAAFYREPRLQPVLWAFSLSFIAAGFRVVPTSLLTRDLRFGLLAALNLGEVLVGALVSLILALTGFGYWALVWGSVIGAVAGTVITTAARPHPIGAPLLVPNVRSAIVFGLQLVTSRVASYAYRNADFAIIGRCLGAAPLGFYQVGWEMAGRPVEKVSAVASQVAYPVLAAVRDSKDKLRRYLLALSEGLAVMAFPMGVGLALVADELVQVLLGDKWLGAVPAFRILALALAVRMLNSVMHQVLVAAGNTKVVMRITLWGLVTLPPLFYLGTRWGITGVAMVWLVGNPLLLSLPSTVAALRTADTRALDYLSSLWRPAAGSIVMAGVVLGVMFLAGRDLGIWYRLGVKVVLGGATYSVWAWAFYGSRLWRMVRPSDALAEL